MPQNYPVSDTDPSMLNPITYEVYATLSPIVPDEDTCKETNFLKHESWRDSFNILISPPCESLLLTSTSAVSNSIYDSEVGATYGQLQNNLLQRENPVAYSVRCPVLMDSHPISSTAYLPWQCSGTLYAGSTSPILEQAFTSDPMSSFNQPDLLPNEAETRNPSYNHEDDVETSTPCTTQPPDQLADLNSDKSSNTKILLQQRLEGPAVYRNDYETGQSLQFEVPGDKNWTQSKPSKTNLPEYTKRVRQQHRVTASKFRTKKNKDIQNLKTKEEMLRKENEMMKLELESLRFNVTWLKSCLLLHSQCRCLLIQKYINHEASKLVRKGQ